MDAPDATVVGGGLAGLIASIHLRERGLSVDLLERLDLLGGKVKGWQSRVPGVEFPQSVDHAIHGYWNNYKNLARLLNRLPPGSVTLQTGMPDTMPVLRFMVIRADRFRDPGGRRVGPPGLREYENFVLVDEPLLSEVWGMSKLHNTHPYTLAWAGRAARAVNFLMGVPGGLALLQLGWLLHHPERLLQLARQDRGYRLMAAALGHRPPLWLDDWSLQDFFRAWPLPPEIADWIVLYQKGLNYSSPERSSAYHIARSFDLYALRSPASVWWNMPVRSNAADVVARLASHSHARGVAIHRRKTLESLALTDHGFHVRATQGHAARTGAVVLATDIDGAQDYVARSAEDDATFAPLQEQVQTLSLTRILVLRVWFKRRLTIFEQFAMPVGVLAADRAGCPFDYIWFTSRWERDNYLAPGEVLEFHMADASRFDHLTYRQLLERCLDWAFLMFPGLKDGTVSESILDYNFNEAGTFARGDVGSTRNAPPVLPLPEDHPQLCMAGDWIRYDAPVYYMEKACVTGIEAANQILTSRGQPPFPVLSLDPPSLLQSNAQWVTDEMERECPALPPPPSRHRASGLRP